MTDNPTSASGPSSPQVPPALAHSLATALAQARGRGADERALCEIIANRLRMKKADTRTVFQRFDSAWHAGVHASLHAGEEAPALEDDAFGHYAFLSGRGGATHLLETHTRTATAQAGRLSAEDIAYYSALSAGHFLRRSLILALVVTGLVCWLAGASGSKLLVASAGAFVISASFGLQAATLIEYLVLLALVALIGAGLAFAGYSEFLLPWLGAGLVGALDGLGQRESQRKSRLARASTPPPDR